MRRDGAPRPEFIIDDHADVCPNPRACIISCATIRDLRAGARGMRVSSNKFVVSDPDKPVSAIVRAVMEQVESLGLIPGFVNVRPHAGAGGSNRRELP